jgi:hypothetical protein
MFLLLTRASALLQWELAKLSPYVDSSVSDMIGNLLATSILYGVICAVLALIGWCLQYRRVRKHRGAATIPPLTAFDKEGAISPEKHG